jgi:glycerophosphoryl diester phosphodiesterase
MPALDWLIARPLAHRGLHDQSGIIENTASAFSAAIARDYGIECDVQISADGEAMVYHDDALGRLTKSNGLLAETSASALKAIPFKYCADRMLTLGETCDLINGRVTLLVEMKSHFNGNPRLPQRVANVLSHYQGPVAIMSFDPDMMTFLRNIAPQLPRGIVAERHNTHSARERVSILRKLRIKHSQVFQTRPQFIAYACRDLPAAIPLMTRYILGLPLLTWTVRNDDDRLRSQRWADQMIFEGWLP